MMFKFTEKVGDLEVSYESDTVQGVIDLKKALSQPEPLPAAFIVKGGISIDSKETTSL
jgi:hypothetical protein